MSTAYQQFADRTRSERSTTGTKQERVRNYVLHQAPNVFSLSDIRAALPGVSDQTIRLVLTALKRDGEVEPDGTGRSTTWRRLGRTT